MSPKIENIKFKQVQLAPSITTYSKTKKIKHLVEDDFLPN